MGKYRNDKFYTRWIGENKEMTFDVRSGKEEKKFEDTAQLNKITDLIGKLPDSA